MGNTFRKPDEDAWQQQNKQQEANPLYKYVNLQKEGKLIDVYMDDGPEAVEAMIRDELEPFLYNQGKGKLITKLDFIKWKNQVSANQTGTTSVAPRSDDKILVDYQEDMYNKFEEHFACWNLDQRGGVGETALHLCVLHDNPVYTDIAKMLLRRYPKMALDYYEDDEYYGESALHLAIVKGSFDMVRLLVEHGANVNLRATGRFFLPEDQKKGGSRVTNYEGYAYYGEYPLAFAACFGHDEIYDYLLDHGADPNLQDTFGNTVLHMLVINNQNGMYAYVVKHHAKKANMEITNYANLTPLTLASKLGRNEIFKEIIELQSVEIWRYSNITCAKYPVAPLDTIGPDGKTNWSSALIYIANGETEEHLEMLGGGVIKQLLDDKWKTFARRRFVERLLLAVLHLATLSIAVYCRPNTSASLLGPTEPMDIVRYIAEIIVCCDCFVTIVLQLIEIRSQGIIGYTKNQSSAPAKAIFNISCLLILSCIPVRLVGLYHIETILLAFAAPCAWAHLLFFARGLSLWGPFVVMIYKMCASDLIRFCLIFVVFLVQFSQGFYFLFKDIDDKNIRSFESLPKTAMQLFQMTLGEFKYEDFDSTRHPVLTKAVFGVFAMLVPILLLNMLIAMMGNTYQQIISRSEKEWRRQWSKIVIVLERTFSRKQLLKYQEDYSVSMGGSARGLMVIKETAKTKARQRKGAISNWKKLVKEIKDLIRAQKKTGKTGPIDLTSKEIADLQRNKNRTNTQQLSANGPSADGLMSAMTQLAWVQDIDLTKGKTFSKQDSDMAALEKSILKDGDKTPLVKQDKNKKQTNAVGISNPAMLNKEPLPKVAEVKQESVNLKDMSSGTPRARRTNRVTPTDRKASDAGSTADKDDKNSKKKPPVPKSATKRNGSGDSKDSAFSEERPKTKVNQINESRASSNSASSLTSLLNAWDDKALPNSEV